MRHIRVESQVTPPGPLTGLERVPMLEPGSRARSSAEMGCASLATHRRAAEDTLGVPVIDPVQAAGQFATEGI